MRTMLETYAAPESIEAATDIFSSEENAIYIAGGTDLVPLMNRGLKQANCLIDLDRITSLKKIEQTEEGIFIGAMTTLSELKENSLIHKYLSPLSHAAGNAASPQIRNMGTIGGNVLQERRCLYFNQSAFWRENVMPCHKLGGNACHQIPSSETCRAIYYSDLAPMLLAYNARARFYSGENYEEMVLEDLIRARNHEDFKKQLLTGFIIPTPNEGTIGKFIKYSDRGSIDFASSNIGIVFSAGDRKDEKPAIRIFAGAVSSEPVRLIETEGIILQSLPDVLSRKKEIIGTGIKELESRASLIRETGVSIQSKKTSLLIVAETLRDFLPLLCAEHTTAQ
jgi:4-hydroxybenzoyl-CoA reductase subunit beta